MQRKRRKCHPGEASGRREHSASLTVLREETVEIWEEGPGRGSSRCKGPGAGLGLLCWRHNKEGGGRWFDGVGRGSEGRDENQTGQRLVERGRKCGVYSE